MGSNSVECLETKWMNGERDACRAVMVQGLTGTGHWTEKSDLGMHRRRWKDGILRPRWTDGSHRLL